MEIWNFILHAIALTLRAAASEVAFYIIMSSSVESRLPDLKLALEEEIDDAVRIQNVSSHPPPGPDL